MDTKNCRTCGDSKPLSDFYENKGYVRPDCKPCYSNINKNRLRKHYQKNKAQYLDRNKGRIHRARKYVSEHKIEYPVCADCKLAHPPWRLDFDHLDSATKVADLSTMVARGTSIESIQQEIDKCELVCANCHRDRTRQRALKS